MAAAANSHILARLTAMQDMLVSAAAAGDFFANATKGAEREAFLHSFLSEILPPHFRFGMGEVTGQNGKKSGQLDLVVEFPLMPSLPMVSGNSPRLYLAEGVLAAIEVKSNVMGQWKEVVATATQLAQVTRSYGSGVAFGPKAAKQIPLYAVGYTGWAKIASLRRALADHPQISGILVIDKGHFVGRYNYLDAEGTGKKFEYERSSSAMALWGLISCLHFGGCMVASTTKNVPKRYDPDA